MRVDHLRVEAACDRSGPGDEPQVAALTTPAAVHDRTLELVTPVAQRLLHLLDEDAEIRAVGTRIHLRDEEDAHPRSFAGDAVLPESDHSEGTGVLSRRCTST